MMSDKRFFIITNDSKRSNFWDRLFGVSRLPVRYSSPQWQPLNGHDTFAYDLDLARLSQARRDRFAGFIALRTGRPYVDVKIQLDTATAYPIAANGCQVEIEDNETAAPIRPFSIYSLLRIVKRMTQPKAV